MIANYHTHTPRCGHAVGSEREYAECALQAGLKLLGFSDHAPCEYGGRQSPYQNIRMKPEELPGYAAAVRELAGEFRGRLELLLGVEAEYYPAYFARQLERLRENGVQYMILGQHFLGNEIDEPYSGRPTMDRHVLDRYVSQTMEAMQTGLFTYFAHPDLICFIGSEREYDRQMRRLCRAALDTDMPLEINILGLKEGRHYPNPRFWRIAGEEGNTVVLGHDAHEPGDLLDGENRSKALALVERFQLCLVDTVPIRYL